MKKEKSLNFLSSKWLMVTFLALGILLFSNTNANAQNGPFASKIATMTELRDAFAPSSAKYDIVQEAIDYLVVLESNHVANPNYLLNLADTTGKEALEADKIRKTHKTILAEYSSAELANFTQLQNEYTTGTSPDPQAAQKLQWILDANAY